MSKNGSQFIINLVKLPEGYAFQSFQQADNVGSKKKNTSKQKPKNSSNRTIHRIFRQLALDPQQPEILLNPIAEESEPAPRLIEPQIQQEFSAELKRQNGPPQSPAKWFDQSQIHQIQKDSLPQFFNGKTYKTPNLYIKLRNFIVTLHRKNPAQYLTKIACRRILRGDVNTIMKIHSFLEKQGVINFGVSKQGNYTFCPSIFSRSLNKQSRYGVAIDKIQDYDQEKKTQTPDMTNITITTVSKLFSKGNRVFCNKCQSICGILWYRRKQQSQTQINSSTQTQNQSQSTMPLCLCIECFENISQEQKQDYVKADVVKRIESGTPQDNKAIWSIDDNLKLLQFVSKQNQSWQPLEKSFDKKKTFDDIMLQFMQFPIGNFDTASCHAIQEPIQDDHSHHIRKLLNRFQNSVYVNPLQCQVQTPSDVLTNQKFLQQMLSVTKNLFSKFESQIDRSLKTQNIIEEGLVQISNMRTLCKKSIQNQEAIGQEEVNNENGVIQIYQYEDDRNGNDKGKDIRKKQNQQQFELNSQQGQQYNQNQQHENEQQQNQHNQHLNINQQLNSHLLDSHKAEHQSHIKNSNKNNQSKSIKQNEDEQKNQISDQNQSHNIKNDQFEDFYNNMDYN